MGWRLGSTLSARLVGVLHRTSIRERDRRRNRLACSVFFQCCLNVVFRASYVTLVRGWLVIDGAVINQDSLAVDDEHVRRGLRAIQMPDLPGGIEQRGRGRGVHPLQIPIFLSCGDVS